VQLQGHCGLDRHAKQFLAVSLSANQMNNIGFLSDRFATNFCGPLKANCSAAQRRRTGNSL
jgi:hypothetical protein